MITISTIETSGANILYAGDWTVGHMMTHLLEESYILPTDLVQKLHPILSVFEDEGKIVTNGQGVGVVSVTVDRGLMTLVFQRASYYDNLASHELPMYANHETLGPLVQPLIARYESLSADLNTSPLPNRPQLALALVTADDKVIVTKRSAQVAVATSAYHASIVGGVRPDMGDCESNLPIPFAAMVRQAKSELGIALEPSDIHFRYLGQDSQRLNQPMLAGFARTDCTAGDILGEARPVGKREVHRHVVRRARGVPQPRGHRHARCRAPRSPVGPRGRRALEDRLVHKHPKQGFANRRTLFLFLFGYQTIC